MTKARPPGDVPGLRIVLLSAPVGESHTEMAHLLGADLGMHPNVEAVTIIDDFSSLGPLLGRVLSRGFRFHLGQVQWSYNLAYRLFTRLTPARLCGEWALYALGGSALAATLRRHRPDAVVSTYPVMNAVLARLRRAGRIDCPAAAVIGPLGGHGFWVQPKLDLHMCLYPEAVADVERLARGAPVEPVRPLVRPEFLEPGQRAQTRARLEIGSSTPLVLLSGGGWGVGDLSGAVSACLDVPDVRVVVVTGRNDGLRDELSDRYAGESRVRVLGFTKQMRDLLCAADVFITATAGLSCIEARLCGCPVIVYGFAVGHVRDNVRALVDHGLAHCANSIGELPEAVRTALAGGRTPLPPLDALPSAADLTIALASPPTTRIDATQSAAVA